MAPERLSRSLHLAGREASLPEDVSILGG